MLVILFFVSLVFLITGAEFLVRGSSSLARAFGIPSLIIGLTIVAFGTSAPELAVSLKSALTNQTGIAVGNVVGSNIFNVLFILGLSALICPLVVSSQLIRFDVPLMIAVSVLTLVLAWDDRVSRVDGFVLFSGLVLYTLFLFYYGRCTTPPADLTPSETLATTTSVAPVGSKFKSVLLIVIGLFLLVVGSRWLVECAVAFAQYFGVSELVIGLTIVAGGTSLPEVVTSIIASLRGERDIAVGNVVGSNLFNLLGVLGLTALVSPSDIPVPATAMAFDLPVMICAAFACFPVFFTGGMISRWEGGFLFGYYIAYATYLVLTATRHESLPVFHAVMIYFVMPLTLITLMIVISQSIRQKRRSRSVLSGNTSL